MGNCCSEPEPEPAPKLKSAPEYLFLHLNALGPWGRVTNANGMCLTITSTDFPPKQGRRETTLRRFGGKRDFIAQIMWDYYGGAKISYTDLSSLTNINVDGWLHVWQPFEDGLRLTWGPGQDEYLAKSVWRKQNLCEISFVKELPDVTIDRIVIAATLLEILRLMNQCFSTKCR